MLRWTSEILRRGIAEESGQATTEYILMLAMMVSLAVMVINKVIRPVIQQLGETLFAQIQAKLFRPGAMHRFRVSP